LSICAEFSFIAQLLSIGFAFAVALPARPPTRSGQELTFIGRFRSGLSGAAAGTVNPRARNIALHLQATRNISQHSGRPGRWVEANLEAAMNNRDETIRAKLLDRLTAVDVDARHLMIEVISGAVTVRGSVPTEEQRLRTIEALAGAHSVAIYVRPVAAVDSDDGRGRSPVTGTSAESAHHSRHQRDPT
jgi:BON domain-containing protein